MRLIAGFWGWRVRFPSPFRSQVGHAVGDRVTLKCDVTERVEHRVIDGRPWAGLTARRGYRSAR